MTYLLLFWEFFKTGLFSIGGGLATLPFLSQMSVAHPDWFSQAMLADMVAVSESTPGPIGINMATYVGYTVGQRLAGIPGAILGALIATTALVLPALIIIIVIARALEKYLHNFYVDSVFYGLRPAVTGLIASAGWSVISLSLIVPAGFAFADPLHSICWPAAALFTVLLVLLLIKPTKNLHPILFIAVGAVVGLILKM